jgi:hypothetical protein
VTLVQRKGKNYYVYADPANNQIFVGTPSQYQKYQQLRLANNLVRACGDFLNDGRAA